MEEAESESLEKKDWSCIATSDTDESEERREDDAADSLVIVAAKNPVVSISPVGGRDMEFETTVKEFTRLVIYEPISVNDEDMEASNGDGRNCKARLSSGDEESFEMAADRKFEAD